MRMVQWTVLLVVLLLMMWMAIDLIDADDSRCSNGTTTTTIGAAGVMLVVPVYARRRTDRRRLRCRGALHRCGRDGAVARWYRIDHHYAMVQRDRVADLADVAQLFVASARRMVRYRWAVRFQVQQQLRRRWLGTICNCVARCHAGRFMFVVAAAAAAAGVDASVHLDRSRNTGAGGIGSR
uniref:Secreted protein n=1 Tax=Anopheles darlingi TaxID=43151 RepID=A0A2M4DMT2_ANODA